MWSGDLLNIGTQTRLLLVWMTLSTITLVYIWMDTTADHGEVPRASVAITTSAVLLAVIKVGLIFSEFMDVRHASSPTLRRITFGSVLLLGAAPLSGYFIGMAT